MALIGDIDIAMRASTSMLGKQLNSAAGQISGFGKRIAGLGSSVVATGAVLAGGLVTVGLVAGIKHAITAASDLNETIDKTNTVFGSAAGSIISAADQAAKAFGSPKREYIDTAAAIGQMGLAAGKSQKDAAALGVEFAKLAADLASQDNLSFEEAADKLRSGLAGEAEPLRRHGVLLSEAAVKTYAYTQGIAKAGKELTEAQKVEARAGVIKQQLSRVVGDQARTFGSASNQFKAAGGGLENFASTIGGILLPSVQTATGAFNLFLGAVVDKFEANKATLAEWGKSIAGVFETASVIIRNWPDVWELILLSVGEKVLNLGAYFQTIPDNLGLIGTYIAGNWRELITDGVNAVSKVFINLAENIVRLGAAIHDLLSGKGFNFEWKGLLDGFEATAAELPKLIGPQLVSLESDMQKVTDRIAKREADLAKNKGPGGQVKGPATIDPKAAARLEELGKRQKSIVEDSLTPLDKLKKDLGELREMRTLGLLDDKQFAAASTKASLEFARTNEGRQRYAGALELGSTEARSAILEHRAQGERDPVKRVERAIVEQTAIEREQLKQTSRLAGILENKFRSNDLLSLPL